MHKQLSKKSHKQTESSVDDFMKHIRKYNLQSQRYISPKPLLYMYTNPSRNFTLHTLDKSRSKSKTLSNRKHSNSKKSSSKTIRRKVQKLLSSNYSKENIHHKKSLSSISNVYKNADKSAKKLNRSTAEVDLTKSKTGLKTKFTQFKLKPMIVTTTVQSRSKEKQKKSQQKHFQYHPQAQSSHRLKQSSIPSQSSQIYPTSIPNPAQLIQSYSSKLFKTQLYLQSTKHKLGSFLCRKFQIILNQIVQSLVQNLKRSLNQLQKQVQDRVQRRVRQQYQNRIEQKSIQVRQLQRVCQKMTKKFTQMLHKQFYSNTLIYRLRLNGVDIDKEFGKAVWGVEQLGGQGYRNNNGSGDDELQYDDERGKYVQEQRQQQQHKMGDDRKMQQRQNNSRSRSPMKQNPLLLNNNSNLNNNDNKINRSCSSSNGSNSFEFHPHPSQIHHDHHLRHNNKSGQYQQTCIGQVRRKRSLKQYQQQYNNKLTKMQQQEIVNVQGELFQQQQYEEYSHQQQQEQQQQQQYQLQQIRQINRSL